MPEKLSEKERKEEEAYWEAFQDFNKFMTDKTNCTVLQHEEMEADDFIARWTQLHPDDEHIIISSDSDFYQLLADNVSMYNGISNTLINTKGFYNDVGQEIIDKKTKEPKEAPDPEWLLFEKCMRGDTSDNIFSAYPGVRTKGTKNKVGLKDLNQLILYYINNYLNQQKKKLKKLNIIILNIKNILNC